MSIKVKGLNFRYAGSSIKALNDLDLEAQPGELLFVIGGNGSGKSTLFSCIAGLVPDLVKGELSGEITIDEIKIGVNSQPRNPVGMVLQDSDTCLFEDVDQEIAYPLINCGVSGAELYKCVFEAAQALGVSHLLQRKMSTLSGGERQKIAVATALANNSSVLLLDEPVEQLDPDAAHEVFTVLRRLTREGKTVVVSGRSLDYAKVYADRIAFLNSGSLAGVFPGDSVLPDNESCFDFAVEKTKDTGNSGNSRQTFSEKVSNFSSYIAKFEQVTHLFSDSGGVEDIDLTIKPGEILAVMGPNGAGKSTLIKHCLGLLRPQKGNAFLFGEDVSDLPAWKLAQKVGMLFQNPDDQIFNERVDKEVAWNLKVRGMKWDSALIEARRVLAELGLQNLCEKHPHELTRSQRQLIALASVLVTRPDLIILDEPSKSLDSKWVAEVMAKVCSQRQREGAIVIVTHDPSIAWAYADRVALIVEGRLADIGNTKEIFLDPVLMERAKLLRHPFVISLYKNLQ